jgi:trimethylamine:corrinoid methyltransferase-like protein
LWEPQIFNRQRLDRWEERGAKDVNARLREITVGILDEHSVEGLPDSVEEDIERILQDETATDS